MASEWKTCRIKDVLSYVVDNRGKTPPIQDKGFELLEVNAISATEKFPQYQLVRKHVSEHVYNTWFRSGHPQIGDILVPTVGTLGAVSYVNKDNCCIAQNLIALRADKDICDCDYLYYILRNPNTRKRLLNLNIGGVQPSIKVPHLMDLEIALPDIDTQKKVSSILRSIDDKIENNQKINYNLLQQAVVIFRSFFSQESNINNAKISDVALNVTDGVHNTVVDTPNGDYFLLSCKNIKGGCLSIGTSERRIDKNTFEKLRKRTKLSKGDVLISSVGTVGEILMLNTAPKNYEFQRSVAIVKPNPLIVSSAYLYLSLLTRKAELINAAHGAVQQCLFISDIADFPIYIPNKEEIVQFTDIVTPLFDLITSNENENIRLSCLRDTLLPKLLSGEIDVSALDI